MSSLHFISQFIILVNPRHLLLIVVGDTLKKPNLGRDNKIRKIVITKGFFIRILFSGGMNMQTETKQRKEVRCGKSGVLLAVISDGALQIRYKKEVNLTTTGDTWVVCRGCGKIHLINAEEGIIAEQ